VKPSNFHFKNKKHRNSLKIMNCCVFISGLKIEFFPRPIFWVRTTIFSKPEQKSKIQLCKGLNTNKTRILREVYFTNTEKPRIFLLNYLFFVSF
ncbi:hypothetical protein, partial [Lactobacillus amylovorus]|uniref:hypothetical protein n=1 Tax=Lactobacillus amylovorus TaxID=1604 RepID=UPI003F999011